MLEIQVDNIGRDRPLDVCISMSLHADPIHLVTLKLLIDTSKGKVH